MPHYLKMKEIVIICNINQDNDYGALKFTKHLYFFQLNTMVTALYEMKFIFSTYKVVHD